MSSYVRKCIDISPTAVVSPEFDPPNDFRKLVGQTWWRELRETTSFARIWAPWLELQRTAGSPPGGPSLAALDAQVETALADGLRLIMVPWRYPSWVNGTAGMVFGSAADTDFYPQDRVTSLQSYQDWKAGKRTARPG